jgi:Tfp pilus assembly protein PilF
MTRRRTSLTIAALAAAVLTLQSPVIAQPPAVYRPSMAPGETLEAFLKFLPPGSDAFVDEKAAHEIEARLAELGRRLRADPARATVADWLLTADFRGGALLPREWQPTGELLQVRRAPAPSADTPLDGRAFDREVQRLAGEMRAVLLTEFQMTAITSAPDGRVTTEVRYDVVGQGTAAWRVEHVGAWAIEWRADTAGWRASKWTSRSLVTSRASQPLFDEITLPAIGETAAFKEQLTTGLDAWMATLDSVLTRDSNAHHGVSVGDADGDGLEDLFIAQPSGLPNRLLRARGDGTFEDVTGKAGLAILDDTAQSLFADIDNDGDQDLVMSTGTRMLLFSNDGSGRFQHVADAFRYQRPPQGVLTSIAMADYDRDGFLDLYVCVYAYFFGAGDDKAGTPAPYHDARNGPPGILLRNDGRGRFVEATAEAGLDAGNDRYHFAAAWADYDEDGWIDLLVANDFGTKNLYRNRGRQGTGPVTFEDVAAQAGVLDHGAGMSAAFVDYDNDGRLDIYTGNMWSPSGLRVTHSPQFMPDAPPDVRALYQRHARGNALFRNLGQGRFEDVTVPARAAMGRWAWSSDALDFDVDGWDDLYVVNGMLTRQDGPDDLDGFFWRQVVARSPLTRAKGTPYDDGWRAINQLLIKQSIASHQRNVLLRNDGRGGFDEVGGAAGLDLDQDGRSFAVFDLEGDGDPDLALMAARQSPQLRLFRNDVTSGARLAVRLSGTAGNRDAIGARVVVETDVLKRTRVVQAGSGFLSQHSRTLLFGLGASTRVTKVTIVWPSGVSQTLDEVAINSRLNVVEGGAVERRALEAASRSRAPVLTSAAAASPGRAPGRAAVWLFEPFPAPPVAAAGSAGQIPSLQAPAGKPAVVLLWSKDVPAARAAFDALARGAGAFSRAGIGTLTVDVADAANREAALSYAIMHRHLFMNRQDLELPTTLLLDAAGAVVRVYHDTIDPAAIVADAGLVGTADGRMQRALPFAGTLYSPAPRRNYLPYGQELLDQGLDVAAVGAFERAAAASPSAFTLYRVGSLLSRQGERARARTAYEGALRLQPDLAEAHNDLGTLVAQDGDLDAAIAHFRAALAATPEYPDALNNLGYALLLSGQEQEARGLYEKALALQPDFPEALNNLGLLLGRAGDLPAAERYFREALQRRDHYGEAATNLALVLVALGRPAEAVTLLEGFLARQPAYESAYLTLAKIFLSQGKTEAGLAVLERLLQRNPANPAAVELVRQWKPR